MPVHLDVQSLVDLVLDGKAVAVPAKPTLHVKSALVRVARYDVLEVGGVIKAAANPCQTERTVRIMSFQYPRNFIPPPQIDAFVCLFYCLSS